VPPSTEPAAFQYTILRVVPRVERGETINVGIVLLCRPRRFLDARVALDEPRLAAVAPGVDPRPIAAHLDGIVRIARGDEDGGPIARLGQPERFHWLSGPSSTVIQPSEPHTGLTADPGRELERLFAALVL
jgi:hypothetical protein